MKIRHTASLTLDSSTTFGALQAQIKDARVPDNAKMSVSHYAGDQREPGYTTITFAWET